MKILEVGLVSNEKSGNSTFYRGIVEFVNPFLFVKLTVFSVVQ